MITSEYSMMDWLKRGEDLSLCVRWGGEQCVEAIQSNAMSMGINEWTQCRCTEIGTPFLTTEVIGNFSPANAYNFFTLLLKDCPEELEFSAKDWDLVYEAGRTRRETGHTNWALP
jgi:hypothetical protein